MAQNVSSISWTETGGTLVNGVEHLPVGSKVTLTIGFNGSGGFTPATGDYIVLSNGGHAVYNGSGWVYTVTSASTAGDLSVGTPIHFFKSNGSSTATLNATGRATLSPAPAYDVVICFLAGTMIATPESEVAVESLRAGDLVSLADGSSAPVTWLGLQTVSTSFADPLRVQPIRVKANALADGVPSRDLLVSPDHALLVDDTLIQAAALVNGVSVVRETEMEKTFTYYHVEVANHALILAENTPAETFIDNVDRMAFDNWDEHPGDVQLVEMDLPRAKSARQVPAVTQARLAARGAALCGLLDDAAAA